MTLLSCCMEGLAAVFLLCLLLGACLERKDHRPVSFVSVKTKEQLACLIDRRGSPALCPGNDSQSVGEDMRQNSWGN